MESHKTDKVRVQTARMLEIYALLKGELEANTGLALTPQARRQLNDAIDTIAGNMTQVTAHIAEPAAENSAQPAPGEPLDQIVDAVLKWHLDQEPSTQQGRQQMSKKEGE